MVDACDIFATDLTGDGLPEIVFLGELWDFTKSKTETMLILGISKSKMEWEFVSCPSHYGFSLDRENSELVILSVPLRKRNKPWPIIVRRFDYDGLRTPEETQGQIPVSDCPLSPIEGASWIRS